MNGKQALTFGPGRFVLQGSAALPPTEEAPTEIEVILAGDYKLRDLVVSDETLNQMVENHRLSGVDPAIDREHESWSMFGGSSPAMGWIKSLSVRPSSLNPARNALVASVEWTDVGMAAVSKKHFRYISAGIDTGARDRLTTKPLGAFLDHVALVKHPYVQHMEPLSLSAAFDPQTQEIKPMKALFKALGVPEEATEAEALVAFEAKQAEIVKLRSQIEEAITENAKLEASAKAAALIERARILDSKVSDFSVLPCERPQWVELAEQHPSVFDKLIALRQPQNPGGPKIEGTSPKPADREALQEKAIQEWLLENDSDDYTRAFLSCAAENPELFGTEEVSK